MTRWRRARRVRSASLVVCRAEVLYDNMKELCVLQRDRTIQTGQRRQVCHPSPVAVRQGDGLLLPDCVAPSGTELKVRWNGWCEYTVKAVLHATNDSPAPDGDPAVDVETANNATVCAGCC